MRCIKLLVFIALTFSLSAQDRKWAPIPSTAVTPADFDKYVHAQDKKPKRLGKACVYYLSDGSFEMTVPPCDYDKPVHSSWPCGDVAGEKCPYEDAPKP